MTSLLTASVYSVTSIPSSINFGNIDVGTSLSHTFTISNNGSADPLIKAVYLTGNNPYQFSIQNNNCRGATLAPSATCTIDIVFSPTKTGVLSAIMGIGSNDPDTPMLYIGLSGSGIVDVPDISLSPAGKDFGNASVDSLVSRTFTISNSGSADLLIKAVYLTGNNPYQFRIQNSNCADAIIAPSESCTFETVFNPTKTGVLSAISVIGSNDPDTPIIYSDLTGTGMVPGISTSPASKEFGNVTVSSSVSQTFTISNNGTAAPEIKWVYLAGDNPYQFSIQNNNCADVIIAPSGSCTVEVLFSPTKTGVLNAFLGILVNNSDTTLTIKSGLTGTSVPDTQQYTLIVTKSGTLYGTVTSSPTGIDCGADCTEDYDISATVTLTAMPSTDSSFTGWTGCDAPSGDTCIVEMDTDKNITATFDTPPVPSTIPPEVPHKEGYVTYLLPPDGFTAGLAWMQAIHDTNRPGPSTVEVDWMRFYCIVNGDDVLLASDEYDNSKIGGGLYTPFPEFSYYGDIPAQFNLSKRHAVLTISEQPYYLWHWWNFLWPRASIPVDAERCFMEARVRIQGPAMVQAGLDYWREPDSEWDGTNVNNIEAGVSDWFFESDGWHLISIALYLPEISASPVSKDFSNIDVGSSSLSQTFTISNNGTADLLIKGVYLAGDNPYQFSIQNNNCADARIAPSGSCTVEVVFSPTRTGVLSALLGILSNDVTRIIYLDLTGTGVVSDIAASPASKEFGNVAVGFSVSQTFIISNNGTADLLVKWVYLAGDNPYQFSIQNNNCANAGIAPSGSCTVEVVFAPTKTGALSALLGIGSNDPDTPTVYSGLTGAGI